MKSIYVFSNNSGSNKVYSSIKKTDLARYYKHIEVPKEELGKVTKFSKGDALISLNATLHTILKNYNGAPTYEAFLEFAMAKKWEFKGNTIIRHPYKQRITIEGRKAVWHWGGERVIAFIFPIIEEFVLEHLIEPAQKLEEERQKRVPERVLERDQLSDITVESGNSKRVPERVPERLVAMIQESGNSKRVPERVLERDQLVEMIQESGNSKRVPERVPERLAPDTQKGEFSINGKASTNEGFQARSTCGNDSGIRELQASKNYSLQADGCEKPLKILEDSLLKATPIASDFFDEEDSPCVTHSEDASLQDDDPYANGDFGDELCDVFYANNPEVLELTESFGQASRVSLREAIEDINDAFSSDDPPVHKCKQLSYCMECPDISQCRYREENVHIPEDIFKLSMAQYYGEVPEGITLEEYNSPFEDEEEEGPKGQPKGCNTKTCEGKHCKVARHGSRDCPIWSKWLAYNPSPNATFQDYARRL